MIKNFVKVNNLENKKNSILPFEKSTWKIIQYFEYSNGF